jgi:O-acetyl-ADP-ribose deacetylase (regulator of RNase III)
MGFKSAVGDLFALELPAIGHGCNCAGAMGAGIAKEFKRRFPEMYLEYRRQCRTGRFRLGDILVWPTEEVTVYNLATQPAPGPSATLDAIDLAVRAALADVEQRGLPRLGIPRIGSGLGGLPWLDVAAVLHAAVADATADLVVATLPDQSE